MQGVQPISVQALPAWVSLPRPALPARLWFVWVRLTAFVSHPWQSLGFSHLPWRPPLETASNWRRLAAGKKLIIYHPGDPVIGHAAALHTALELSGELEGTAVIRLGGSPRDAHNEHPGSFAPREWAMAVAWMRAALQV